MGFVRLERGLGLSGLGCRASWLKVELEQLPTLFLSSFRPPNSYSNY